MRTCTVTRFWVGSGPFPLARINAFTGRTIQEIVVEGSGGPGPFKFNLDQYFELLYRIRKLHVSIGVTIEGTRTEPIGPDDADIDVYYRYIYRLDSNYVRWGERVETPDSFIVADERELSAYTSLQGSMSFWWYETAPGIGGSRTFYKDDEINGTHEFTLTQGVPQLNTGHGSDFAGISDVYWHSYNNTWQPTWQFTVFEGAGVVDPRTIGIGILPIPELEGAEGWRRETKTATYKGMPFNVNVYVPDIMEITSFSMDFSPVLWWARAVNNSGDRPLYSELTGEVLPGANPYEPQGVSDPSVIITV